MEYKESTFDKLVKTISTAEAQKMLKSIRDNVGASAYDFENSHTKQESAFSQNLKSHINLAQEPFFLRFIFRIIAFFTSSTVSAVHTKYLLKQLASELKRTAKPYYLPATNVFINDFYQSLKELRRTQLFFSGLLQAYDAEKGEFYIILSSFVSPEIYEALLKKTDPFSHIVTNDPMSNTRANLSRDIDTILGQLTEAQKTVLYDCAKSIEWIKNLCDASLDKALLRFSGPENESSCLAPSILSEMQVLSSVLNSARKIPDEVLQTLFLLYNKENIALNVDELKSESEKFKTEASNSLKSINRFLEVIPMVAILQYVSKDINWAPLKLEAGEDWYIFFKHAWKERLAKKWDEFLVEQEKEKLRAAMITTLEVNELQRLTYTPWEGLQFPYFFTKQMSIEFIKTLFTTTVPYFVQVLTVIAVNGKFVRKDNENEFVESFANLKQFAEFVQSFEALLSPEGEIGMGFEKLHREKVMGLSYKKNVEMLFKSVETNARQIISACTKILQSIYALLNGILSNNKKGLYATLSNLDTVNGPKTDEYMEKLRNVYKKISQCLSIFDSLEKIEK